MKAPLLACAAALSLLSGCATAPGQDRLAEKDPLEKFNRGVWGVNRAVDTVVLKPASGVYRAVAPRPVRQGVDNFFANLTEPWSFINNLLQGKVKRAGHNVGRFFVNSTIGIGGLFDQASKIGIPNAPEDFGQTLARWGFNGGPYLVLPILGPSTARDGIGSGIAFYADPVNLAVSESDVSVWWKRGYRALAVVSARADLTESGGDAFLKSSLDPYAAARSAYLQRRRAQILDQEDSADAGPPDDPAADTVPTPVGDAAEQPANGGTALPASGAPLPGDAPAAPPGAAAPSQAAPDTSTPALPASAAPLPGDDAPAAPPRP